MPIVRETMNTGFQGHLAPHSKTPSNSSTSGSRREEEEEEKEEE